MFSWNFFLFFLFFLFFFLLLFFLFFLFFFLLLFLRFFLFFLFLLFFFLLFLFFFFLFFFLFVSCASVSLLYSSAIKLFPVIRTAIELRLPTTKTKAAVLTKIIFFILLLHLEHILYLFRYSFIGVVWLRSINH